MARWVRCGSKRCIPGGTGDGETPGDRGAAEGSVRDAVQRHEKFDAVFAIDQPVSAIEKDYN
jgi:hypothetical protein